MTAARCWTAAALPFYRKGDVIKAAALETYQLGQRRTVRPATKAMFQL